MTDPRVRKLASILVRHSLGVKKGETVLINASSELAKPLVLEVYREVLKAGAHPTTGIAFEETANIFYSLATEAQLMNFPKIRLFEAKNVDCVVNIRATANKKSMSNIDPALLSARSKVLRPISEEIVDRKRWILCNYPTNGLAQEADMSLDEYEDFLYNATNINWMGVKKKEMKLKNVLDKASEVRIVGKDTDLMLSIKGRKAIPCYGERNMPDGEVFLSPVEDSAEGRIYYETIPPGLLVKQIESGGVITTGNMTWRVQADAYLAGLRKVKQLIGQGLLVAPAVPYVTNQLAIMVPKGNPAHITGLADLGRPDVRLAMPNPEFEGIARQIRAALVKAGGEALADTVYGAKVKDGSTILTQIHHRQTPLWLMQGRAQAGVTWRSEAMFQEQAGNPIEDVRIPPEQNATAIYAGALVKAAPHPEAGKLWLDFIRSPRALEIFARYGFAPYRGDGD